MDDDAYIWALFFFCCCLCLKRTFLGADETSKDVKIMTTSETILHGLKKYTNYSMQILAFTSAGDGVKSEPVTCHTEQDGGGPIKTNRTTERC